MKSMRILLVLFAIIASLLILMACQPAAQPAAPAAAPEEAAPAADTADEGPKYGGTLTIAIHNISHLDVNGVNSSSTNVFAQLFYETLTDRDAEGVTQPLLIKEIEQSADGLVHTWTLQPNVTFHDGTAFNADVVKWNLDRKLNEQKPMHHLIPFDTIEVVDDMTVKVTLSRPYPGIYNVLAVKTFSMYSPTFFEQVGDEGHRSDAVGTGPFMVDEYIPNEVLRLKKNPDYWQEGLPYLDEVIFRVVPDDQSRATMMEAGEADISLYLSYQDVDRFQADPNITVHEGWGSSNRYITLTTIYPPLDDIRVRKAMNYAVDKEGLAATVFRGYAVPAPAIVITEAVDGYAEASVYKYDPDKAMALLDEAGWTDTDGDGIRDKDGNPLELSLRTTKRAGGTFETAELVQGWLKDVGIQINLDIVDAASFLQEINQPIADAPRYEMINIGWGTFTGDAHYPMSSMYSCDALPPKAYNYSHYCNEEIEAMITAADEAATREERNAIYAEVIKAFNEEAPVINLVNLQLVQPMRNHVKGVYPDFAQGIWPAKWAWLDK